MTLYEIDRSLKELLDNSVDPETGELVVNEAELNALNLERDLKIENICLYVKDYQALADALEAEKNNIKERLRKINEKIKFFTEYVQNSLAGEKFETAKVKISYHKSKAVVLDDEFINWAKEQGKVYLTSEETYTANKTAIGAVLKAGGKIPHAMIEERTSMKIK